MSSFGDFYRTFVDAGLSHSHATLLAGEAAAETAPSPMPGRCGRIVDDDLPCGRRVFLHWIPQMIWLDGGRPCDHAPWDGRDAWLRQLRKAVKVSPPTGTV